MTLTIEFGALCDPIANQLIAQGYSISKIDSDRLQEIADAIVTLKLNNIIPESVVRASEQKLMKQICLSESFAERDP